jgi:nucleotide-binding universal stress UspA family protein
MIKTLLTPLDGSALAERALPYAAHLARATNGRLLLLHASTDLDIVTPIKGDLDITARIDSHLVALRSRGIDATSRAVYRLPASAILSVVREDQVDLIVMSTHGRGGIGRWIYGSITDKLLREAGVPLLLVPPTCDRRWEDDRPLRILVPLDGSLHSETALTPARELGARLPVELLLVRAIEEPTPESYRFGPEGYLIPVPAGEGDLDEARQYLEAVGGQQSPAFVSVDVHTDLGGAASVIADAARHGSVDLIVMATHGRTGLERLALGSVATKVLQTARTPVLLLRPALLSGEATNSRPSVAPV